MMPQPVLLAGANEQSTKDAALLQGAWRDDRRLRTQLDSPLLNGATELKAICTALVSEATRLGRHPKFANEEPWIGPCRGFEGTLSALFLALQQSREDLTETNWKLLCRELRADLSLCELLHQDPMTKRACDKPRGYAGDAVMMDYLYGIYSSAEADSGATEIGRRIFRYVQRRDAAQAVRFRREHIAGLIDQAASQIDDASVLAVASGHLREAELSKAVSAGALSRFVAFDVDAESIAEVYASYSKLGVETVHGSVRHLLSRKHQLGQFNLVYASGLYDYLANNVAQALTARLFELTAPGGTLLIPNFSPCVSDRAYMECFMDWHLIYRDEYDMNKLLAHIDGSEIANCDIYADPAGTVVYISVRKAA